MVTHPQTACHPEELSGFLSDEGSQITLLGKHKNLKDRLYQHLGSLTLLPSIRDREDSG